jgi:hypothetical protein
MKMFYPPTDKTYERCQKGAEWGLLAVLAPFVKGSAGIFEISTHGHFRQLSRRRLTRASAHTFCAVLIWSQLQWMA